MKIENKEFLARTVLGDAYLKGVVYDDILAIDHRDRAEWAITHVPSGRAVCFFTNKHNARYYVKEALAIFGGCNDEKPSEDIIFKMRQLAQFMNAYPGAWSSPQEGKSFVRKNQEKAR